MQNDLGLALRLADAADAVTLGRFRAVDLSVERKADRSPVTDADLACEDAVRDVIALERPGDGVLGEERGGGAGPSERIWVLDPIDGTKNFSRGLPMWATLIALTEGGRPTVGVLSAPALGRRWWAAEGLGAFTRDRIRDLEQAGLSVSGIEDLAEAYASSTDLDQWRRSGSQQRWLALAAACWETRGFGDFWQYCLLAEGLLDVAVDPAANAWDLAAVRVLVEQAGGRLTDLAGATRHDGGSGVATNGRLHEAVLDVLGR